jgi:AcrR family transcriptional regulator
MSGEPATVEETGAARRPPGRPRSARAHAAILHATLELLADTGYHAMTMEEVQRRAGVGKATIYRRWSSKEALVKDAIGSLSDDLVPPDTGSLPGDFAGLSRAVAHTAQAIGLEVLMPRLLSEVAGNRELHAIFSAHLVEPRRRALRTVLERARARGEVRDDVDLEVAIDLLVGPIIYRFIVAGGDVQAALELAPKALEAAVAGLAPR